MRVKNVLGAPYGIERMLTLPNALQTQLFNASSDSFTEFARYCGIRR